MLYICIPAYNEAPTIGVLLWSIRKVLAEFPREYALFVYNDGSTDATGEVLAPYRDVLGVTVLGGDQHVGYARALDSLIRAAIAQTRYPRRDAVIIMQGDFTDRPEHLPELIKRFEGGADIVVAESPPEGDSPPPPVRRLRRVAPWVLRPFPGIAGIRDPFGSYRLFRVSVLRDAVKAAGDEPLVQGEGWAANVDLLLAAAPHARRIEKVALPSRYDLRPRPTRVRAWSDAVRLYRFGRELRSRRSFPSVQAARA
ncbi:MAG TPA: glycosyltransferase family 2 protein [Gemmatimonadaceae bacterium]